MRRNAKTIAAVFAFLGTSVLFSAENHYEIYCYDHATEGTISIVSSSQSNGNITEVTINGKSLEELKEDGVIASYKLSKTIAHNGDPIKIDIIPSDNFTLSSINSIEVETSKGTALSGSCRSGYYETSLKISVVRDLEKNEVKVEVMNIDNAEHEMDQLILNGKDVTKNAAGTRTLKPNQKIAYFIPASFVDNSVKDTAVVVLAQ